MTTAAAMAIAGLLFNVRVAGDACEDWARIVDIATRLPENEKLSRYEHWKARTYGNKNKYQLVLHAIAWVEAGGTSASAWRLCVSY